jgi:hypothetical protein
LYFVVQLPISSVPMIGREFSDQFYIDEKSVRAAFLPVRPSRARGIVRSLLRPMLLIERSRLLPEPRAFATFMNRKKAG